MAREMKERLVEIRRDFHRHPETGFNETRTGKVIADHLEGLGLKVESGVGRTGICGLLEGSGGTRCIAVRADMDALPMQEEKESPYRSANEGVMHSCGHDAHMTCALGAAAILSRLKEELGGSVKFIFQPAEEMLPGGARLMIEDGILEHPAVNAIISLHTDPLTESGKIAIRGGPLMASADIFTIGVTGDGGHGALPHLASDTVVTSAEIVAALQTIASRRIDPLVPVVVSICSIHGGTSFNILPAEVELKGTVRTLSREARDRVQDLIKEISENICCAHRCRARIDYREGVPVLVNDGGIIELVRKSAVALFGEESIRELKDPIMGGEDFAFYLERIPGAMFWLGVRNAEVDAVHSWHSPYFDIDEEALPVGAAVLSEAVCRYLEKAGSTEE